MKKLAQFLPYGAALSPMLLLAQAGTDVTYITDLIASIANIIGLLIPVVIALGLLLFIWGLVQYIAASGDEAAKEEGKRKMIWGVISLFIIVSIWGLVALLNQLTGVNQGDTFDVVNPIGV